MIKYHGLSFILLASTFTLNSMLQETEHKTVWDAEKYKKNSSLQQQAAAYALEQLRLEQLGIADTDHILDVGCGDGKITRSIADVVLKGKVVGIDADQNQIEYACKNHTDVPHISFKQQNALDLKSKAKYDKIVSFFCTAWVENKTKVFRKIARALKPAGIMVILDPHKDNTYLKSRFDMLSDEKWKQYFVNYKAPYFPYDKEMIDNLLKKAKLTLVKIEKIEKPATFESKEKFIAFLGSIPAQIDQIPEEYRQEFILDMANHYIEQVPLNADGALELRSPTMMIIAQKQ